MRPDALPLATASSTRSREAKPSSAITAATERDTGAALGRRQPHLVRDGSLRCHRRATRYGAERRPAWLVAHRASETA